MPGQELPGTSASGAVLQPTRYRTFLDARPASAEMLRYAVAGMIVAATCTGLAIAIAREPSDEAASEIDNAVMIDLPPAEASSLPASDAAVGPEQQAMQAAPAEVAPPQVEPPKPVEDSKVEPEPQPPVETPPPPVVPDPTAVIERKQEKAAPPPKPVAAPPTPAQEERAPPGSDAPKVPQDDKNGDEGRPHASRHAITLWQRSLMGRLEAAKRLVKHVSHAAGTASVAFHIDWRGGLASERLTESSGSAALDRAALELVRMAAPFPAPPPGSGEAERFFVVPIRFR